MKLFFAFVLTILLVTDSLAQYAETLVSDRPGLGNSPLTVGKRVLQVQPGMQFKNIHASVYSDEVGREWGTDQVIRYGLFERVELSTCFAYQYARLWEEHRPVEKWNTSQISKLNLSARWNILAGNARKPSIGLLANFEFFYRNQLVAPTSPSVVFMISFSPFKELGVLVNVGLNEPIHRNPDFFFLLNTAYQLSERFSFFMEYYLEPPTAFFESALKFDTGMAFLVHNNLQLDFFIGRSAYNGLDSDWFVNMGASWRINALR